MTLRLVLAVLASLLLAPPALAGTIRVEAGDGAVLVTGSDTADVVDVALTDQGLVVTPGPGTGTESTPADGCVRDPMTQAVTCPGAGTATVRGEGGDDRLTGGAEDDVLDGGPGADVLDGGAGDDDLAGGPGADELRGGEGTDRARFPGALAQRVTLDDVADDGGAGEGDNARADVEDVTTGSGADTIAGSAAANEIASGGGADTIDPGAGADRVRAGAGDDEIRSRDDRSDAVVCGDGADRLISDPADDGTGCERVDATAPAAGPDLQRPALTLTVAPAIAARDLRKGIPMTLASDELITAEVEIVGYSTRARVARAGDFVLASRTTRALVGERALLVKIARRRLRMIRRRALLTVRVSAVDAAGNVALTSARFRVR
jgi:Ca2+-binding RTX toxin-like protein